MADAGDLRTAALDLAAQFQLTPEEVASRSSSARSPDYWRGLSSEIQISGATHLHEHQLDARVQSESERFFNRERYFQLPPVLAADALVSMNAIIDAVTAAGWPSVFAVISDHFWQCARSASIRAIVNARLGVTARQASQVWLHVVPAIDHAAGWRPHFDGFRNRRVTVWMALTAATVTNGCMYVVPPLALPPSLRTMDLAATVPLNDAMSALHASRALPVEAGATVGWDFDVLHWGSRASNPESHRRAISLVFVAPDEVAQADEEPLLDLDGPLPAFEARLASIARSLRMYGKREPMAARYLPVARALGA